VRRSPAARTWFANALDNRFRSIGAFEAGCPTNPLIALNVCLLPGPPVESMAYETPESPAVSMQNFRQQGIFSRCSGKTYSTSCMLSCVVATARSRNRTWGRLSVGRCAFDAIVGARLNNLLSHAHVTEDRPKYEREPDDDPHGADTLYIFYVVLFR
jgi:hypothetical protein